MLTKIFTDGKYKISFHLAGKFLNIFFTIQYNYCILFYIWIHNMSYNKWFIINNYHIEYIF